MQLCPMNQLDQPSLGKVIYSSSKTDFVDDPTAHSNLEQLNYSVQGSIAVLAVGVLRVMHEKF